VATIEDLDPDGQPGTSACSLSAAEIGARLKAERKARFWTGRKMAEMLRAAADDPRYIPHVQPTLIRMVWRWERGGYAPSEEYRFLYCKALGMSEEELFGPLLNEAPPQKTPKDEREVISGPEDARGAKIVTSQDMFQEDREEEMERRRLLQSLAALGVGISPLSQALETVRTVFGDTVGYDELHHLDHWEEAVVDYGYSYLTTSPADLVPNLAADLVAVRSVMRRIPDKDSPEYRSWCRVGGTFSALMAKSLSNLGQPRNSREWWSMAEHLTNASGDLDLVLWVHGERIIHGFYENRPVPVLLRQVESATNLARNYPCAGLAKVSTGRAQSMALAGDYRSAERELHRMEAILNRLPSAVTSDNSSVMGWAEDRFLYTQAWVYSYMGDEVKTDHAVERVLPMYPESAVRAQAQVKFMQAFARVGSGDISEGIRHAQTTYESLAPGQSTAMVNTLARRVLNPIPAEAQKHPEVAEYKMLVASRTQEGDS
jgi:transcriptional regulator with XRE-family HTH domain